MKKIILLLYVVPGFNILLAQENKNLYQEKVDSIQKLLNAQPRNDTIKVKRLNDLARICFFDLQFIKGFIAAKDARQLAEKLLYKKGEEMYLRTMADLNTFSDLSQYYDKKAKWFNEKEDVLHFELTYPDRAWSEKAKSRMYEALKFYEKTQDKEAIAQIAYNIGFFNQWLNKPNEVLAYLDQSIKLFKEINQDAPVAIVLSLKMYNLEAIGKTKEAEEADSEANRIISGINNIKESCFLSFFMCHYYYDLGKKAFVIERELKLNKDLEKIGEKELRILVLEDLAENFGYLGISQKPAEYYKKAILLREEIKYYDGAIKAYFNFGFDLVAIKEFDEAKNYFSKGKALSDKSNDQEVRQHNILRYADAMGQILMGQEKYSEALAFFNKAEDNEYTNLYKANCYYKLGNLKEAIIYGEKASPAFSYGDNRLILNICVLLSEVYEKVGQPMKAYKYLKKYRSIIKEKEEQDIANRSANLEIQSIIEKDQREKDLLEKAKLLKEKQNQNQRWWLISIAGALLSTFVVLFVLYRNNQNKQKANALLQKQKEEIQHTLSQLKATQSQLIQSEKMASLGELTAGIAHEIQNPLNFVNNFSEVNAELIDEMQQEMDKGNLDDAKVISNDIKENEQKIIHHGKRADAIVKGMLQHSSNSSGVKEPTDINALANEYLRLSYQGFRAKDKTFNATLQTNFDDGIGKINMVPQDIGRVLLNLYNNAFYAVGEKKKQGESYKPTVSISTKKLADKIEIGVRDNGNGIPQKILDKIFQPFFTTKPTGQGTGLGLSLSYDIIKAHGGEIKVETKNRESLSAEDSAQAGTTFIVLLPQLMY